jgi:hypothetical protein
MTSQELLNEFLSLPAEAQSQVINFIAFLRQKYAVVEPTCESLDVDLINHGFIGMWSDRKDLADSTAWVHNVRENEWSKSND